MPTRTPNTISISENGPLGMQGELEFDGQASNELWFCRCGKSTKKPFCDGSHRDAGFADAGTPEAGELSAVEQFGKLRIVAMKDGPLLVNGYFRIVGSDGKEALRAQKAALCRCGHSKNKPFCDGAHRSTGFSAA